jgi:L-cysteine desulfidase
MGRLKGSKNRKVKERIMEKYFVSDASGGKEVEIPIRKDPFEAILKKAEADSSKEVIVNESQAAGDALVRETKNSFVGKEEEVVVDKSKDLTYGHCNNCRLELTEDKVVKQPIEYQRAEDGSFTKIATRFSVFCKNCMKFITLIDQQAVQMLQDMIHKNK